MREQRQQIIGVPGNIPDSSRPPNDANRIFLQAGEHYAICHARGSNAWIEPSLDLEFSPDSSACMSSGQSSAARFFLVFDDSPWNHRPLRSRTPRNTRILMSLAQVVEGTIALTLAKHQGIPMAIPRVIRPATSAPLVAKTRRGAQRVPMRRVECDTFRAACEIALPACLKILAWVEPGITTGAPCQLPRDMEATGVFAAQLTPSDA